MPHARDPRPRLLRDYMRVGAKGNDMRKTRQMAQSSNFKGTVKSFLIVCESLFNNNNNINNKNI